MEQERSCGAVIYRFDRQYYFLVLQHKAGHWAYAKGHMEADETQVQTAIREIQEETGLDVELNSDFKITNNYSPKLGVNKEVTYFIAYAKKTDVKVQLEEIKGYVWLTYDEARAQLTYENDKKILDKAYAYLKEKR